MRIQIIFIIDIIIVFSATVAIYGCYYSQKKENERAVPIIQNLTSENVQTDTSNWLTFKNKRHYFEISYPVKYKVSNPNEIGNIQHLMKDSEIYYSIVESKLSGYVLFEGKPRSVASLNLKEQILLNLSQRCKVSDLNSIKWVTLKLGGVEGIQAYSSNDECINKYLPWSSVIKNEFIYHIKYIKGSVQEYNKIINTFKFIR